MTLRTTIKTIFISSFIFSYNVSYALTMQQAEQVCENDVLYRDQAIGRNAWEFYCGHMTLRTYRYYKYSDAGFTRFRVIYNAYYYVNEPSKKFMAPTSSRSAPARCTIPTNVKNVTCKSDAQNFPGVGIEPGPDPENDLASLPNYSDEFLDGIIFKIDRPLYGKDGTFKIVGNSLNNVNEKHMKNIFNNYSLQKTYRTGSKISF